MGLGPNDRIGHAHVDLLGLDWSSLGSLVQSKALDAVARHFLDRGLTELCLEALQGDAGQAPWDVTHE